MDPESIVLLSFLSCVALMAAAILLPQFINVFLLAAIAMAMTGLFHARIMQLRKRQTLVCLTESLKCLEQGKPAVYPKKESGWLTGTEEMFLACSRRMADAARKEQALVDNALDVICTIDSNNQFLSVNSSCVRILGYNPEELIGKRFVEFLVQADVRQSLEDMIGSSKSLNQWSVENQWRKKDGRVIDLLWSAHWSSNYDTLFCVIHDITLRKKAERRLAESEQRLRMILDGIPLGIALITLDDIVAYANPALGQMTGYVPSALMSERLTIFFSGSRSDTPTFEQGVCETYFVKRTGETFPVELIKSHFNSREQETSLLVISDISERLRIEQMKHEMVAMLGHELKSPLTSLKTMLGMLSEGTFGKLSETAVEMLIATEREINRMVKLINELLDVEKMKTGNFSVSPQTVPLSSVILSSIEAVRYIAESRKISIIEQLQETTVYADGSRIIQVMVNLLSNAIKFSTASGTIVLSSKVEESHVIIQVTDHGRGIKTENLDLIFDKFKQAENSDSRYHGGTGLGLPICKMIVEKHGGQMGVESQYGRGSTFWFTLPLCESRSLNYVSESSEGVIPMESRS